MENKKLLQCSQFHHQCKSLYRTAIKRCGQNLHRPFLRADSRTCEVHLDNVNGCAGVFLQETQGPFASSGSTVATISHDKTQTDPLYEY